MAVEIRDKKQTVIHYKRQAKTAGREIVKHRSSKERFKTAGGEPYVVRVDERGRVTLPASVRAALGVQPGTTFYVEQADYGFRFAKPENPFEGLARHAIAEDDAGRTRDLREYARERGIKLGGE